MDVDCAVEAECADCFCERRVRLKTGTYESKARAGLVYEYEVTWTVNPNRITWNAKVRRDGEWKGTPNGVIYSARGLDAESVVTANVESSIEKLLGMTA
jgi:hypothetical protein